jgi:hypothetical protein
MILQKFRQAEICTTFNRESQYSLIIDALGAVRSDGLTAHLLA